MSTDCCKQKLIYICAAASAYPALYQAAAHLEVCSQQRGVGALLHNGQSATGRLLHMLVAVQHTDEQALQWQEQGVSCCNKTCSLMGEADLHAQNSAQQEGCRRQGALS